MNIRQTAALVAIGWYLITPRILNPDNALTPLYVATLEPFSNWDIVGSYGSAAECREDQIKNLKDASPQKSSGTDSDKQLSMLEVIAAKSAKCIVTDDPRLKR